MATFTPNLNLGKPDASDAFSGFRLLFNDNMDKIDQSGGGGGGGGSVLLGMYIDTDRIITSGTYSSSFSYTATEDCAFRFVVSGTSASSGKVYLDGVIIQSLYVPNNNDYQDVVFIKKGQTVRIESQQSGTWNYTVYGLTQGTNGIFAPVIYSDNERLIGIWRDNKPLYQKTFVLPTPVSVSYSSWDNMGVSVTNGENIIICLGIATDGTCTPLMAYFNSDTLMCQSPRNGAPSYSTQYITIQYTKTTDAPGSGNWNTDGVPTVHYSTAEQVIGTWIDGKPLYQITVDVPSPVNDSNEHLIDLTALSIEECPYLFGHAVRHSGANDITYYANSIETDGWYYFKARYDNFRGSIMYVCLFRNDSISQMRFTIQYTKTTD